MRPAARSSPIRTLRCTSTGSLLAARARFVVERFNRYHAGDSKIEDSSGQEEDWSWETAWKRLDVETADRPLEDGPTEGRGRSM